MKKKKWDVFISHASEDKDDLVNEIVRLLEYFGVKVWYDSGILDVGDSLSKTIDKGLLCSKFGIIVLSENFIKKGWTEYEFRSLLNREVRNKKLILPIWHRIKKETIEKYCPFLLDKYALDSSKQTATEIVISLLKVIKPAIYKNITRELLWRKMISNAEKGYINYKDIKPSEIRHKTLPKELMLRITSLHYSIFSILELDLEKMIDSFKRDLHPQNEIVIWEFINLCFQEFSIESKSHFNKKDILSQLLLFSLGSFNNKIKISENDLLLLLQIWKQNWELYMK